MTVARITEISSVSTKSFEDAIVQGVERANKTLKNVIGGERANPFLHRGRNAFAQGPGETRLERRDRTRGRVLLWRGQTRRACG